MVGSRPFANGVNIMLTKSMRTSCVQRWALPAALLAMAFTSSMGCGKGSLEECQREKAELSTRAAGLEKTVNELKEKSIQCGSAGAAAAAAQAKLEQTLAAREGEVAQLDQALGNVLLIGPRVRAAIAIEDRAASTVYLNRSHAGLPRFKNSDITRKVSTTLELGPKVLPLATGLRLYTAGETQDALRVESIKQLAEKERGLELTTRPGLDAADTTAAATGVDSADAELPEDKPAAAEETEQEDAAPRCTVISISDPRKNKLSATPGEVTEGAKITNIRDASTGRQYVVKQSITSQDKSCEEEGAGADCVPKPSTFAVAFYAKASGRTAGKEIGRLEMRAHDVTVQTIGDANDNGVAELLVVATTKPEGSACTYVEIGAKLKVLGEITLP